MRHRVKSNAIIHELLNDEIILANLDSGVYYSIRGCGIPVWQMLLAHYTLVEIAEQFHQRYAVDAAQSIAQFIHRLEKEELVIKDEANSSALPATFFWPSVFDSPSLEKYEEMKNLLMLDPIHEVDEQGWPSRSV